VEERRERPKRRLSRLARPPKFVYLLESHSGLAPGTETAGQTSETVLSFTD